MGVLWWSPRALVYNIEPKMWQSGVEVAQVTVHSVVDQMRRELNLDGFDARVGKERNVYAQFEREGRISRGRSRFCHRNIRRQQANAVKGNENWEPT